VVVYTDLGVSPGVRGAIEAAERAGLVIERRNLKAWSQTVHARSGRKS
jgi:hypothetical protein